MLDKAVGAILSLLGILSSLGIWLFKRSDKKIEQVATDLANFKDLQAKQRLQHAHELSELKAELRGVSTALNYINKNISSVNNNLNIIQEAVNEISKEIRK